MFYLSIDHINGDGSKHRKEIGGGGKIYKWLINNNFPSGFQVLCIPCNLHKGTRSHCGCGIDRSIAGIVAAAKKAERAKCAAKKASSSQLAAQQLDLFGDI